MKVVTYGIGGYDPSKPNNNIVEEYEVEDFFEEPQTDVSALAETLSQLPPETLEALKQALGLGGQNG